MLKHKILRKSLYVSSDQSISLFAILYKYKTHLFMLESRGVLSGSIGIDLSF